jgi:hypothetical protein
MKPIACKIPFLLSILVLSLPFGCSKTPQESSPVNYISLKEGFINPPVRAQPKVYWWWLNGNTDTVRMKEELVAIKAAGIGGVDIFEIGVPTYTNPHGMIPAGPAFMSEPSKQQIKYAIREASKLGLEIGFNLASSWNAGGTWTLPKNAAKSLYYSTTRVKGLSKQEISLPFPEVPRADGRKRPLLIRFQENGKPEYYEDVAVLALPADTSNPVEDTTQIFNITQYFDREREVLTWDPPAGEWNIVRYVCANSGEALKLPSPNSQAPIIDHYDSSATRAHFMHFINELQPLLGDFNETGLKNFYLASYEATGSVWTSTLPAAFKKVNGYDVYKLIPALFEKEFFGVYLNKKFEDDFTRTLSHLIINNHYRKGREIANKYGLKVISEAGGPGKPLHNVPVEALSALGSLDIPRGEFWNKHHHYDKDSFDIMWLVKEIAAASNIYQRNIVEEESFTSFEHWQEGPFDLKPLADRAFCEGMNRVVVHGFTHNPKGTGYPGIVYHAGTHYNDKRVWWPKIRPFNEYLARISFILQEADFVADVLHYYGDKIPNFVYPKNTQYKVGDGYDYEVINTEILLRDLNVEEGKLTLPGGAQFNVLSLENESEINPAVLQKLRELVANGAVVIGGKPLRVQQNPAHPVPSGTGEAIDKLWATSDSPVKGKVVSGISPLRMLEALGIGADFRGPENKSSGLDYVHYAKAGVDFYLIQNTLNASISHDLDFRQRDKKVELWDPVTGDILDAPIYRSEKNYTRIPITLPPYGSMFVVFRNGLGTPSFTSVGKTGANVPEISYTKQGIVFLQEGKYELLHDGKTTTVDNRVSKKNITGPWEVSFPARWGAPENATFENLISWTESPDAGIQYFSGIATYSKTFDCDGLPGSGDRVFIDLGDLEKVGDVWLNDEHLGIAWSKPYRFDVTEVLRNGENKLRIEIANTWSNRLTGDAIRKEKYTSTNITLQQKLPWAEVPLLRSGLFGPVTIQTFTPVK